MVFHDQTCGLTNTAISEGEQCLIIILNPCGANYQKNFTLLWSDVIMQHRNNQMELTESQKRLVDKGDQIIGDYIPFRDAIIGTYDQASGIKETDRLPSDYYELERKPQFFHVWAVEFVLCSDINDLLHDKLDLALSLYTELRFLRKSPLNLSGQALTSSDEMKAAIELNERTNRYLSAKIAEYKKYEFE